MSKTLIYRRNSEKRALLHSLNISLIFLCLSFLFSTKAQEKKIITSLGITRFDLFHSFEYAQKIGDFEVGTGIGYGVKRTIFQQRYYPKLSFLASFDILKKKTVAVGPAIEYSLSILKLNRYSSHWTNWNEFFVGLQHNYGKKWKIGETVLLGYFVENYYSKLHKKRINVGNWAYNIQLKVIYEL